jgi:hypothetical protein
MRYYLNETFRPFGVPYNARYVGTVEIGSNIGPGLGLEVGVWEGQTEGNARDNQSVFSIDEIKINLSRIILLLYRRWILFQLVHNQTHSAWRTLEWRILPSSV